MKDTSSTSQALNKLVELFQAGSYSELENASRTFLQSHPDDGHGWHMLGLSLVVRGHGNAALPFLQKASELLPQNIDVWDHLGSAYAQLGRYKEAISAFHRALNLRPNHAVSYNNLGNVLMAIGLPAEAETNYRRAVRCQPNYGQAYGNLGMALSALGQMSEALECLTKGLHLRPHDANIHVNRGNCLKELGKTDESIAAYEEALQYAPDHVQARTNLLLLYAFSTKLSPENFLLKARELGQVETQRAMRDQLPKISRTAHLGERLRIGYVSGDFCNNHPVPFFLGPILAHHNKERVEIFLYPTRELHGETSERLASHADHWTPLQGLSDRDATLRIREDNIDVLIDLSGHSRYNRLSVFARRAAPVQAHFLGYCATTGIEQMDYWIGDDILFPPNVSNLFSETPWFLPRVWMSYDGRKDLSTSSWRPDSEGTVWLGSFNHLSKIQNSTMDLWAQILHEIPNGKLLLKSAQLDQTVNRERIIEGFSVRGIHPERLRLLGGTPNWQEHMATYNQLDIALDPVDAVSGATTTCDTLWMGVPVVTLIGKTVGQRMAASLLTGLGRPEWIANTTEEYKEAVIRLALDVAKRTLLRQSQRDLMLSSPLSNPQQLAACLEDAFMEMQSYAQNDVNNTTP